MIKKKGVVEVRNSIADKNELLDSLDTLKDGKYLYLLLDKGKNRALPQLKYLFGIVLKTISENLPGNPPINALYKYFEELYAPIHTCNIKGERVQYADLKTEKSGVIDLVIKKIIHHAKTQYNIDVQTRESLKESEAREVYAGAYAEEWKIFFKS